jgi:hypothetical protein
MDMKANMGNMDRIIRAVVGLALVVLYTTGVVSGILGIILLAIAIIFFATALLAYCPVYPSLGISTCKARPST